MELWMWMSMSRFTPLGETRKILLWKDFLERPRAGGALERFQSGKVVLGGDLQCAEIGLDLKDRQIFYSPNNDGPIQPWFRP